MYAFFNLAFALFVALNATRYHKNCESILKGTHPFAVSTRESRITQVWMFR